VEIDRTWAQPGDRGLGNTKGTAEEVALLQEYGFAETRLPMETYIICGLTAVLLFTFTRTSSGTAMKRCRTVSPGSYKISFPGSKPFKHADLRTSRQSPTKPAARPSAAFVAKLNVRPERRL
jgi:hypothetical protein